MNTEKFTETFDTLSEFEKHTLKTVMMKMEHPEEFNESTELTIKNALLNLILENGYDSIPALCKQLGSKYSFGEVKDFINKYFIKNNPHDFEDIIEKLNISAKELTPIRGQAQTNIDRRQNSFEMFLKRKHKISSLKNSDVFEDLAEILEFNKNYENIEIYLIQNSDEYIEKCKDIKWLYSSLSDYNKDVIDFLIQTFKNIEDYKVERFELIAPDIDLGKDEI